MILLNVGSGGGREVPAIFRSWKQHTLDIDPACKPDIVCDAKRLATLKTRYDAIYCSHNIEHFYKHEVPVVLSGMLHVLKPDGFAYLTCPDFDALLEAIRGRDIDDTWYKVPSGSISFHDVLFGWGRQVAAGNQYYCHRTAFTGKSLGRALKSAGFKRVMVASDEAGNLHAYAFKAQPGSKQLKGLGL